MNASNQGDLASIRSWVSTGIGCGNLALACAAERKDEATSPRNLALAYGETTLRIIALETVVEIKASLGQIPREKEALVIAARACANRILRTKEQMGGRMEAQTIWRVWNEVLNGL